ncbi:hypothetical protein BC332_24429 [Capsicum chinense]|nr:hypothetical protein BC332_24429 [Capsicum chinense]
MGQLCVVSDKIPGATDSAVFMIPTHYSSIATGAEDNEHGEEESFKRDDPNANSPSVEKESCFGKYLDLPEDNNARFHMKMVYDLLKCRFMYENKDKMNKAWAFEVIPYLRQQVNYQEEVSCPRILRWLSAKIDKNAKFLDRFNPPKEAIVHSWLVSSNRELKMPFFLTLRSVQTLSDPKVDITTTYKEHNMIVDNPSTASKDEEKVDPHIDVIFTTSERRPSCKHKNNTDTQQAIVCTKFTLIMRTIVDIPINCGDEFHWVLAVVVLKERCIRVYDSMSRRRCFGPSSEIQKLVKILPTYLDMSGFLDQKDCGPFVATYVEYLSDGLQVTNDGLDTGLLLKRYATLLWKYGEAKAQNPYATDAKDP